MIGLLASSPAFAQCYNQFDTATGQGALHTHVTIENSPAFFCELLIWGALGDMASKAHAS